MSLQSSFEKAWNNLSDHKIKNIVVFDPPIPAKSILISPNKFRNFLRSDHAAFWVHKNNAYSESLNAVLLTDMGKMILITRKT